MRWLAVVGGWMLAAGIVHAQAGTSKPAPAQAAPEVFVDEGACPFECCTYRTWTPRAEIAVLERPERGAPQIAVLAAGHDIQALDGHVRTRGVPFHFTQALGDDKPGDVRMVYTYQGEGFFRTWKDGRWEEAELAFSPYGGTGGTRCTESAHCVGYLERELQSEWWVRVRLPDGRTGWVDGHAGFDNQDACG